MINTAKSNTGKLIAIDLTLLPFIPQRLFIVNNVPNQGLRSNHAHRKDYQILFCLCGSLSIELTDKNLHTKISIINAGDHIHIPPLTWSKIRFLTSDSELICLCSERYDENEYIRDYQEFLRITDDKNI